MTKENNNQGLIAAIIFAAVVVSGSLIYFGSTLASGTPDLTAEIEKGIEAYVEKQIAEQEAEQQAQNQPATLSEAEVDDDPVLGDPNAPVTMIEFSDYQCPFCRKYYSEAYGKIKENYVDKGLVKIVFRDFPLSFHKDAVPAAIAAECVREQGGDDAYFEMHDALFEAQSGGGTNPLPQDTLDNLAKPFVSDFAAYQECTQSEEAISEVAKDLNDGKNSGVQGTPAFFINGQYVSGAQPFEVFEQVIENEL